LPPRAGVLRLKQLCLVVPFSVYRWLFVYRYCVPRRRDIHATIPAPHLHPQVGFAICVAAFQHGTLPDSTYLQSRSLRTFWSALVYTFATAAFALRPPYRTFSAVGSPPPHPHVGCFVIRRYPPRFSRILHFTRFYACPRTGSCSVSVCVPVYKALCVLAHCSLRMSA